MKVVIVEGEGQLWGEFGASNCNQWGICGVVVCIDVINVYNVYKKFFVNAFIILSTFISIKIT